MADRDGQGNTLTGTSIKTQSLLCGRAVFCPQFTTDQVSFRFIVILPLIELVRHFFASIYSLTDKLPLNLPPSTWAAFLLIRIGPHFFHNRTLFFKTQIHSLIQKNITRAISDRTTELSEGSVSLESTVYTHERSKYFTWKERSSVTA